MADAQTPGALTPEPQQQENGDKDKKPVYKKAWFWILIVVIVLILFVSCSSSGESDTESTTTDSGSAAVEQTEEATTEDEESEEEATEEEAAEEETTEEDGGEFEETVLYDENGITITATGIEEDWQGVCLDLSITNEASETVSLYGNDDFSIGDTMTTTNLSATVSSGKTANEQLVFYDLSTADELTDFTGTLTIFYDETYDTIDEPEISMSLS